jgi:hypothetical protein
MPEIAEICTTCANQKDGRCYGFGRVSIPSRIPGSPAWDWCGYPRCPEEREQNGMPCREWKEREPKEEIPPSWEQLLDIALDKYGMPEVVLVSNEDPRLVIVAWDDEAGHRAQFSVDPPSDTRGPRVVKHVTDHFPEQPWHAGRLLHMIGLQGSSESKEEKPSCSTCAHEPASPIRVNQSLPGPCAKCAAEGTRTNWTPKRVPFADRKSEPIEPGCSAFDDPPEPSDPHASEHHPAFGPGNTPRFGKGGK